MSDETTFTLSHTCTNCGITHNRAHLVCGEWPPHPGDISLCGQCALVTIFTEKLEQRLPTEEEIIELVRSNRWEQILLSAAKILFKDKGKN